MENNSPQFVNIVTDDTTPFQVDYDEELLKGLVDSGWIEFTRTNNENKVEHRIYNPEGGVIKFIKWVE